MPRNTKFPVMNAVNTFPSPRKQIASIAPEDRVRSSNNLFRARTAWWRSGVETFGADRAVVSDIVIGSLGRVSREPAAVVGTVLMTRDVPRKVHRQRGE